MMKQSQLADVSDAVETEKHNNDGLTQSERFMQAARELGCDDDPERFKERVKKLADSPVKPHR